VGEEMTGMAELSIEAPALSFKLNDDVADVGDGERGEAGAVVRVMCWRGALLSG
jgi:hypothetical protein